MLGPSMRGLDLPTRLKHGLQGAALIVLRRGRMRSAARWLVRVLRLPAALTQRLPVEAEFSDVYRGHEIRYRSHRYDGVGRAIYWQGIDSYEPETLELFHSLSRNIRTFVDVGANTGIFTVTGLVLNPDLHVHAFEPSPGPFSALEENVRRNQVGDRARLNRLAVAESSGTATLHVPVDTWASASLDESGFHDLAGDTVAIETTTLDRYVEAAGIERVDLVKVDVEGFEHTVLRGAAGVLRHHRPAIICECLAGARVDTLNQILESTGYAVFGITPGGRRKLDGLPADLEGCDPNFLFAPAEQPVLEAQAR